MWPVISLKLPAAFAVLERASSFMEETGQPFDVALAVTRAGNLSLPVDEVSDFFIPYSTYSPKIRP